MIFLVAINFLKKIKKDRSRLFFSKTKIDLKNVYSISFQFSIRQTWHKFCIKFSWISFGICFVDRIYYMTSKLSLTLWCYQINLWLTWRCIWKASLCHKNIPNSPKEWARRNFETFPPPSRSSHRCRLCFFCSFHTFSIKLLFIFMFNVQCIDECVGESRVEREGGEENDEDIQSSKPE